MPPVIPYWIDYSAPWVVYAFALLAGSAPERIVAGMGGLALSYSLFVQPHGAGQMLPFEFTKHLLELALMAWLAIRYERWWLLVAGMATLLLVATEAAGMIEHFQSWALGTAAWTWEYIFLAALAAGTWRVRQERRGGAIGLHRPPPERASAERL